ncbi:MAG: hypothetical protein AAB669_01160 [Patescibacteria group bacterium]
MGSDQKDQLRILEEGHEITDTEVARQVLRAARTRFGVEQKEMAAFLGVGSRTYQRWEQEGTLFKTPGKRRKLCLLQSVARMGLEDAVSTIRQAAPSESFNLEVSEIPAGIMQAFASHGLSANIDILQRLATVEKVLGFKLQEESWAMLVTDYRNASLS